MSGLSWSGWTRNKISGRTKRLPISHHFGGDDSLIMEPECIGVLTAAQFIKANMPHLIATKENPKLTDEEAFPLWLPISTVLKDQKKARNE